MTLFSPKTYPSRAAMMADQYFGCHSDTQIVKTNGIAIDVFGFVNDEAYACQYYFDEDEQEEFVVCDGEVIDPFAAPDFADNRVQP